MHPSKLKMSPYQLAMLLIPGIASTAILGLPAITVAFAVQDAWMAGLVACPAAGLVIWITGALARRFPHETIIEYAPRVLGIIPGKVVGALLLWYFFHLDAAIAREFSDFLITTSLPNTPASVILGFGVVASALAVRYGPEILGRLGELFTPLAFVMITLIVVMVFSKLDFTLLQPTFEYGVRPILVSGFITQAFMGQFILLAVLLPSVTDATKGVRASYWALGAMVILITAVSLVTIAAFGVVSANFTWPFLKVARIASVGPILARIDPVIIALWIGGSSLKLAIHLYATTLCFAQLFGLPDYRPLALPMGALVGAYALGHLTNIVEHGYMLSYFWPPYTQLFHIVIPGLILAVAVLSGKGESSA